MERCLPLPIIFRYILKKVPDDVAAENRSLVQMFNAIGQCVYNGNATIIPVRQSGVYFDKINFLGYIDNQQKVVMKKGSRIKVIFGQVGKLCFDLLQRLHW